MRFLLLGDHPDGVAAAMALATRHEFAAFAGPEATATSFRQLSLAPRYFTDAETALAQKDLDWAIVADDLPHRETLLKRALQSELNVAVVHPPDLEPDIAYEALLILQDTRKQLVPLLPDRTAPALVRLGQHLQEQMPGPWRQVELEVAFSPPENWADHPLLTLWEPLRFLAGEIQDLTVLNPEADALRLDLPLVFTGRFSRGGLFQVMLAPKDGLATGYRLTVRGERGEVKLHAPAGWFGEATMETAQGKEVIACSSRKAALGHQIDAESPPVTWTEATRCLELFDAAKRCVKRKRLVVLDYEAVGEVGNFKSTMAALGCGTLILIMILFFATPTFPFLKYLIIPLLAGFLLLQLLRWLAKDEAEADRPSPRR